MALKDLVSDLSNFKGQSQYDGLDNQIKKGVDFFDNETGGADGFTPKTNLESRYHKVRDGNISAPNAGVRLNKKTRSAYGTFDEYSEAGSPGLSNPSHVLSADNVLGVRIQPQFLSDFMDTPLANYNSKLSPPDDITQTFSLEPKFQSLPDFTQWGGFTTPWSMEFPQFQSPFMTTPLANYNSQYSPETTTETFVVPKEAWRISADSSVNDTFQPNFSPIALQNEYNNNDKIKDLFKFTTNGPDTFTNVPNGINIYGQFGTADFRKVANKGPFEGNDLHPIILRKPGSNWDNYLTEKLVGGTIGNLLNGALGIVGLKTRTSVGLADKARVGRFLISSKGIRFLAKQFAFQALNPTLESKVYNPFSTLGVAGANQLLQGELTGILQAAASFLFPTHVQRHLDVSSFLPIAADRYETLVEGTNDGFGRLSYQSEAFSSNVLPTITLPEIPKANTGNGFLNKFVDKLVDKGNKKIQDSSVGKAVATFNSAEAAAKLVKSNPNRYLGYISTSPVTIEKGVPNFFASPLETPTYDIQRATDKKGKTFNSETHIDNTTPSHTNAKNVLLKRHSTLSYGQLKNSFSYEQTLQSAFELNDPNYDPNISQERTNLGRFVKVEGASGTGVAGEDVTKRFKGLEKTRRLGVTDNSQTTTYDATLGNVKGGVGPNGGVTHFAKSDNVDRINMIPYGSNDKNSNQFPATEDITNSDFIKFRFRDVVNNKWIIFRAILDGISDSISPEYSEERYIGRPDKVYTYQGADRNISFGFSIYPKSKQELPILMEKLNYLVGLCYPTFTSEERMITPFIELTMGDMFVNTPGLLGSLTVTVEEASTWEIQEGLQFPHFIKAQCEFKHIGKYVPASKSKHYDLNWLKANGLSGKRYGGADLGFNDYPDRSKEYRDSIYSKLDQPLGT